jgi:hypothetical protein
MAGSAGSQSGAGGASPDFDAVCTPAVELTDEAGGADEGLFVQRIPNPQAVLQPLAKKICSLLFTKPEDVPPVPVFKIQIQQGEDGATSVFQTPAGMEMRFTSGEVLATNQGQTPEQHTALLTGRLVFWLSVSYLSKTWAQSEEESRLLPHQVVVSLASVVRQRLGYPPSLVGSKGSDWTRDGGAFLGWVDDRNSGFLRAVVASAKVDWTPEVFQTFTGQTVDAQWAAFQATIP